MIRNNKDFLNRLAEAWEYNFIFVCSKFQRLTAQKILSAATLSFIASRGCPRILRRDPDATASSSR